MSNSCFIDFNPEDRACSARQTFYSFCVANTCKSNSSLQSSLLYTSTTDKMAKSVQCTILSPVLYDIAIIEVLVVRKRLSLPIILS